MKNYKLHYGIILVILALALTPFTLGFMNLINQFSNGLSAENLTFTGNQNITRYANVSVDVTDAYLNLSGIERFSYIKKYDSLAIGCKTQHFAASIYGIAVNDTTMSVYMPATQFIMEYYGLILMVVMIITGIIMYSKLNSGGQNISP